LGKRWEILNSEIRRDESDLLRAATPTLARLARADCDYRIAAARGDECTYGQFGPVSVWHKPPVSGILLRGQNLDALLDLGAVLRTAYNNTALPTTPLSITAAISCRHCRGRTLPGLPNGSTNKGCADALPSLMLLARTGIRCLAASYRS